MITRHESREKKLPYWEREPWEPRSPRTWRMQVSLLCSSTLFRVMIRRTGRRIATRIARAGFEAAKKAKPAAFFTSDLSSLVTVGNFEDDLAQLKDCDLIIEAVVENPEIKRSLYEKVEQHRRPGSIIASNTSGIPLQQLAEGRSEDFRAHFLGMHFFNPPRYMHLVEIIRTDGPNRKSHARCSAFSMSVWAKAWWSRRTGRIS
jgi:3-hydroxyacyl-CoA dehydrogenase